MAVTIVCHSVVVAVAVEVIFSFIAVAAEIVDTIEVVAGRIEVVAGTVVEVCSLFGCEVGVRVVAVVVVVVAGKCVIGGCWFRSGAFVVVAEAVFEVVEISVGIGSGGVCVV